MSELDDLLEILVVPPTDPAADVARGERRLRRRRRTQVAAVAVSVAAVATVGFVWHGSSGSPGAAGFADGSSASASPHNGTQDRAHDRARQRAHDRAQAARQQARMLARLARQSSADTLQTYHDVLAEHLDPNGDLLRLAQNEQGGSGTYGTKLDWKGGGMLEIVVGRSWGAAGGFYLLENAHLTPTTYDGQPARVSTKGDDVVVSVQHQDGTVVTLIASTSFGNNGTSTSSLGLTQHQLLAAAADPRLKLPPYLR
jgi:hypothetical protein